MGAVGPGARRLAAVLGPALVVLGVVAFAVGLVHWLEPTWASTSEVAVPMQVSSSDGRGADLRLEVDLAPYSEVWVSGVPTGGLPDRDHRSEPLGIVVLHAPEASLTEQLLSRADLMLRGVALLVAAIALRPVLVSIAEGGPFRPGHEHRLRVVAGCVIAGGYLAPLLPWWASASVLARLEGAYGLTATPTHHLEAFVVAALVVLIGAVVRASTPDPHETAGRQVRNSDSIEREPDA
ncbi:hypothetical protein [Cellulomonas sp. KRMCY2]|uniref:hypothetical protein n=1 Tax=Cellulomonas sp. KRMCY2 TaxID=1304865 RepID=UPI0012DE8484|nr:hypothetical protein [Cellulomonas sp. KRMCY2]